MASTPLNPPKSKPGSPLRIVWRSSDRYRSGAIAIAALCLAVAAVPVFKSTVGITYPHDVDQLRDLAAAQSVADGRPLADPFYLGETLWYNPLLGLAVGGYSALTRTPVPAASIAFGVLFNTLVVALFFAAATMLVGPWAALVAVVLLLFSRAYIGIWVTPSYSPWLFATNFASAFFYVGVMLCASTAARPSPWRWPAIGAVLGLTFLAHTAPALILGICVLVTIQSVSDGAATALQRLLVVLVVALVVSSPFLRSIGYHYRFRIENWEPIWWVWPPSEVSVATRLLWSTLTAPNALAAYGFLVIAKGASRALPPRILLTWFGTALSLFIYGWIQQMLPRQLPTLVPQYHFYYYVRSAGYIACGIGAWRLIDDVLCFLRPHRSTGSLPFVTTALASLAFVAAQYSTFLQRDDFHRDVERAAQTTREFEVTHLRERLRTETGADAVILARSDDSLFRVAPSGRRVVAVKTEFSNPYIPSAKRQGDQVEMLEAFIRHDLTTFRRLADSYHVTHVLLSVEEADAFDSLPVPASIKEMSRYGGYVLFETH